MSPFLRPSNTVEQLKLSIQDKEGLTVDQQRLFFDGLRLENGRSLASYNIPDRSSLHLALQVSGGGSRPLFTLERDLLDPQYNCDFTDLQDDGSMFERGGREYIRPYGWNRVALNVKEKYEDTDWLGGTEGGFRTDEVQGEWAVSYHGTKRSFAQKIVRTKYDLGRAKRFRHGRGIYSTPDPEVAGYFARVYKHQGRRYKVILQNRIKVGNTVYAQVPCPTSPRMKRCEFFITENENNIRPYGLLYKEV